jgi:hypothetical protein
MINQVGDRNRLTIGEDVSLHWRRGRHLRQDAMAASVFRPTEEGRLHGNRTLRYLHLHQE